MSVISALKRLRQKNCPEFKGSLGYLLSSRVATTACMKTWLKKRETPNQNQMNKPIEKKRH